MTTSQWWQTGCYHLSQHSGKWLGVTPTSSNRNIKWRSQEQNGIVKVTHMPQNSLNTVRIREGKLLLVFIHDHTWLLCSSMSFSWLPESVDIYTKLLWPTSWCYIFSTTDLVWMYEAVWSWPAHSGLVSFFAHHLFSHWLKAPPLSSENNLYTWVH